MRLFDVGARRQNAIGEETGANRTGPEVIGSVGMGTREPRFPAVVLLYWNDGR